MTMTTLTVPNADFSAGGNGIFSAMPLPFTPFASYLLAASGRDALVDRSGNGRDAIPVGNPRRQPSFASLSNALGYYVLPVTGDALAAAGGGAISVAMIARAGPDQQFPAVSTFTGAGRSFAFALPNDALFRSYATSPPAFSQNGADPNRGARWGFFGGVITKTGTLAYSRHFKSAVQNSTLIANASHEIGGVDFVRIGGDVDGSQGGQGDIAAVAIYAQQFDGSFFDQIYPAMQAAVAPCGVVV